MSTSFGRDFWIPNEVVALWSEHLVFRGDCSLTLGFP